MTSYIIDRKTATSASSDGVSREDILMSLARVLEETRCMVDSAERGEVFRISAGTRAKIKEAEAILANESMTSADMQSLKPQSTSDRFKLLSRQQSRLNYAILRVNSAFGLSITEETFHNHYKLALEFAKKQQDDDVLIAALVHANDPILAYQYLLESRSMLVKKELFAVIALSLMDCSIIGDGERAGGYDYQFQLNGETSDQKFTSYDMAEEGLIDAIISRTEEVLGIELVRGNYQANIDLIRQANVELVRQAYLSQAMPSA